MKRTLLIDDAFGYRTLLADLLDDTRKYHVVGEAENGLIGVQMAKKLQPDLVVLDLSMPVMDGFKALPLILEASPESRVIILTGYRRHMVEPQLLEAGAIGCLEKGIVPDDLLGRIDELLALAS